MTVELNNVKPTYMSSDELLASDIYLKESVLFEETKKYLIKANSGHGKSSILNFIYGSNNNYDGNIYYNKNVNNDLFKLRKSTISYVFQDFKLFPSLTTFENIQLKNTITNYKTDEEINALIKRVRLDGKSDRLVEKLSLGQKQRVAILRALCQPFEFILLDEPFSHLDEENIKIISDLILEELQERNAGLIMTSLGDSYFFDFDKVLNL